MRVKGVLTEMKISKPTWMRQSKWMTLEMYMRSIDNDGPVDNPKFLDELQPENNVDALPNLNPNPEWFTSNTWDDIHDPSPSLEIGMMSWRLATKG